KGRSTVMCNWWMAILEDFSKRIFLRRAGALSRLISVNVLRKKKILISALLIMLSLFLNEISRNSHGRVIIVARICPKIFHCVLVREEKQESNLILRSLISEPHPDFVLAQVFITRREVWYGLSWHDHNKDIIGTRLPASYQQLMIAVIFLSEAIKSSKDFDDVHGRILFAGVGAQPLVHFIRTHHRNIEISELTLNDEMWNLTARWFNARPISIYNTTPSEGNYDVILFDQCSNYLCPSAALLPFAASLQRVLKRDGIFVTNINAPTSRLMRRNFKKANRTLSAAYGVCFSMEVAQHTEPNKVFVCGKGFEDTVRFKEAVKNSAKFVEYYHSLSNVSFY
uniref:Uncharacterized protein n=1 Tax=Parascaris univalens TaxID=6257 RepID=A0A915B876_PARUN